MPLSKYRFAALSLAVFLVLIAILLGISIAGALFNLPGLTWALGQFFADSYGFLGLLIPGYLIWAAVIVADSRYQPKRIFILSLSLFPFLTLAAGFSILRDFEELSKNSALLTGLGQMGLGFCAIVLTVAEGFIIAAVSAFLFKPEKKAAEAKTPAKKEPEKIYMLPQPPRRSKVMYIYGDDKPLLEHAKRTPPALRRRLEWFSLNPNGPDAGKPASEEDMWPLVQLGEFVSAERGSQTAYLSKNTELANQRRLLDSGVNADEGGEGEGAENAQDRPPQKAVPSKPVQAAAHPPRQDGYRVPVEDILTQYPDGQYWAIDQATRDAAVTLKETLEEFRIQAEVTGIRKGPVITMFEILPAPGVKLSRIVGLQDNIALRMAAQSVRIVAPIPGKHAVGIEVPNKKRNIVSFREIIEGELQREGKKGEIPVILGKDITGEAQTVDLTQTPHLLIAGATGAGKSVCVNCMILSILYQRSPAECRLILIDPKIVELKLYNDIPHLLTPVITEPKRAFQALQYCIYEMERRYACLDSMGVRDIRSYNRRIKERSIAAEHMPYIVVVIDEFADLMATTGKELESTVARLAAMSRAVGIHLVLATQRPSIDVITGLIKANIPSRIAFMVASKMDSRIIIDMVGAEKLLGKGDMLYAGAVDPFPVRMQGAFISEEEVERVVEYVKGLGEPDYIDDEIFIDDDDEENDDPLLSEGDDPLYEKALEIVTQQGKASASYIQRRLKIGYNRAARLVELMEHRGVVGPAQGSKPRELLRGAAI